jgi:hypothetical protein
MATTDDTTQSIPVMCDLGAIPAGELAAHQRLIERVWHDPTVEREELPDGFALRFSADRYHELVSFIANERLCCPAFRFTLEVAPGQGPIWLRISGGPGVKEALATGDIPQAGGQGR